MQAVRGEVHRSKVYAVLIQNRREENYKYSVVLQIIQNISVHDIRKEMDQLYKEYAAYYTEMDIGHGREVFQRKFPLRLRVEESCLMGNKVRRPIMVFRCSKRIEVYDSKLNTGVGGLLPDKRRVGRTLLMTEEVQKEEIY